MPASPNFHALYAGSASRRLIVNADDFGLDVAVNAGIVAAHRDGIVTSTTVMATGDALADAAARLRDAPGLAVGCHVLLVDGVPAAPAADVRSLIDASGRLPPDLPRFFWNLAARAKDAELALEIRAQLERLRAHGITPAHCDSHKHTHAHPRVATALFSVLGAAGIRAVRQPFEHAEPAGPASRRHLLRGLLGRAMRHFERPFRAGLEAHALAAPAHFRGFTLTGSLDTAALLGILATLGSGATELMCHPAAGAVRLGRGSGAPDRRRRELAALTDLRVRDFVTRNGIQLMTFTDLGAAP